MCRRPSNYSINQEYQNYLFRLLLLRYLLFSANLSIQNPSGRRLLDGENLRERSSPLESFADRAYSPVNRHRRSLIRNRPYHLVLSSDLFLHISAIMSYTYTDYHHRQFDRQLSLPLPMPSPTSCWYPQRQDVQFGFTPHTAAEWQQLNHSFQSVVQSASQEKILDAFPKLETRWDSTDRRVNDWRPPPVPEPPPHPATDPLYVLPPWETAPPHQPSSWDLAFQPTDLSGQQWYPNVGYSDRHGHQPPHGQNQYSLPPFEPRTTSHFQPPPTSDPAPPYFGSTLLTPYQTSEYQSHQFEYQPPLVQDQYAHDAHSAPHSGWYQQPHYSNPNIVEQTMDPYNRLEAYQQRADDQRPAQPPYMGFNLPEPPPHLDTEPLGMPRDPVMPNLEPNLSLEALVSQLERLTTIVRQLESQMDANEHSLGDPDAATRLPPAAASNVHQPLRSASHYSAAPFTGYPHINPDIAGSLQQPPTQHSHPCSHDIRYGSIESLADDIDAHESVHSRQIRCDDILSDKLLNRDPIGDDKAKDVIHSSVEGSFTLSNVEASKELIVQLGYSGIGRNELDTKWILEKGLDDSVDVLGVPDMKESKSKDDWQVIEVKQPKSMNLGGRGSVPAIIYGSSFASSFSQKEENGVPSIWDPWALFNSFHSLLTAEKNRDGEAAHIYFFEFISKVYMVWMDPISRGNYEKYCHSDCMQRFQMGIALPKFILSIIDGEESKMEELGVLLDSFDVGEFVPWIYWIKFVNGMRGRVRRVARNIDEFLEFVVREHIGKRKEREKDFVDVLLEVPRNERCGFVLDDIPIKAIILDIFATGGDTTFTLIEWMLSAFIRHKKAKNEFFFMVNVLPLHQLCASNEHLHAIDPGGDNSPKILFTTVFILCWFPP